LVWTARALREKFLAFFEERGHAIIPSASLIPENDPTVLFTTAGMHPLVPFLLGQPHPLGKRLANVQKCLRTDDIDDVGDAFHHTFFEMLGNWSLGDYFKKEAIAWSFEFLTDKRWLGLDSRRLSVTVFAGDKDAPKDEESAAAWRELGIPSERIFFLPKRDNWWGPAGATGPCGPDTEMFFDSGARACEPECKPNCACGKYFEVWNDVFLQYNKTANGKFELLKQRNVDTGMGVERTLAMLNGCKTDYETDVFAPIIKEIKALGASGNGNGGSVVSQRIVADHLRAAAFVLAEGGRIVPSNVEQGYVLRRLVRRAVRHGKLLGIEKSFCGDVAAVVVGAMGEDWPELERSADFIRAELDKEEKRFSQVLGKGVRSFERLVAEQKTVSAKDAFLLYQSFGFPLEMTLELAKEHSIRIDKAAFEKEFEKHQAISRKGAEQKFRSGLADESAETTALHTATHLLHAALRKVLGNRVHQKGSNITAERLRFDFSFERKMAPEEVKKVEEIVNQQIEAKLPVERKEETLDAARKEGALAFFDEKYAPDKVSVYSIGGFSKEVCTGPHVKNTSEIAALGRFRILKEEAVSAGVRRIKAVLAKD
jgi:alanyl-tRNA synthetase